MKKTIPTALVLNTTFIYASDIDKLIEYGILISIPFIIIAILYIISQNKFIDSLKINNSKLETNKVWTWTQLIPIWSIVAQIIALIKMTDQYKNFLIEKNITSSEITEYKPLWGWLFIGFIIISAIIPFASILALVFSIMYWVNISNTRKSIQLYLNTLKKESYE